MSEHSTIAVNAVIGRNDGCISLHVGDNFILLMPDEVRKLIGDLQRLVLPMFLGGGAYQCGTSQQNSGFTYVPDIETKK